MSKLEILSQVSTFWTFFLTSAVRTFFFMNYVLNMIFLSCGLLQWQKITHNNFNITPFIFLQMFGLPYRTFIWCKNKFWSAKCPSLVFWNMNNYLRGIDFRKFEMSAVLCLLSFSKCRFFISFCWVNIFCEDKCSEEGNCIDKAYIKVLKVEASRNLWLSNLFLRLFFKF